MTRPRVHPDQRKRTAQACDSCKKRKQKCNGFRPCSMCSKRHELCVYTATSQAENTSPTLLSPPQGQGLLDATSRTPYPGLSTSAMTPGGSSIPGPPYLTTYSVWPLSNDIASYPLDMRALKRRRPSAECHEVESSTGTDSQDSQSHSVFDVHQESRMLEGPTNRPKGHKLSCIEAYREVIVYVGDSATLAYLQIVRKLFGQVHTGKSDFTEDKSQHKILERVLPLPPTLKYCAVVPDKFMTEFLVGAFFDSTTGFLDLFDRVTFLRSVKDHFDVVVDANREFVSQLHLVLAIGLVIADPRRLPHENKSLPKLFIQKHFYAEAFFENGKALAQLDSDFESATPFSVEVLLLVTVWKLVSLRRISAHHFLGLAVQAAYEIGLHKREYDENFGNLTERKRRQRIWTSLFNFDGFLSAAGLGRPRAIPPEDSPELPTRQDLNSHYDAGQYTDLAGSRMQMMPEELSTIAAKAATRTSRILGLVLRRFYAIESLSAAVAADFMDKFDDWNSSLPAVLHWTRLREPSIDAVEGLAILHVNVFQLNAIILLTRPFYLYHVRSIVEEYHLKTTGQVRQQGTKRRFRYHQNFDWLARACVEASYHIVYLAHTAIMKGLVSQDNPFIIHPVFTAILIVLTNRFTPLYQVDEANVACSHACSFFSLCAPNEQAGRYLEITNHFLQSIMNIPPGRQYSIPMRVSPRLQIAEYDLHCDPMTTLQQHSPVAKTRRTDSTLQEPRDFRRDSTLAMELSLAQPKQLSPEGTISNHSAGSVSTTTLDSHGAMLGPLGEAEFNPALLYEIENFQQISASYGHPNVYTVAAYPDRSWYENASEVNFAPRSY